MSKKVHLELLIGSRVRDANGKVIGRIASVHAERRGDLCYVLEYRLGAAAYLQRLGISVARVVGWPLSREPQRIPWNELDISDPENPRTVDGVTPQKS
jgi:hypothetical protein